ncbi:alpha-amylase family glycosyl hydrolase [Aquimarina agarilytica]|uniref:alpha-amylase family glycosyl hydrolase n=1 Tax=Aquimarina agarilytica TaxID=1087449 RepID=UPI000492E3AF|nr:alpha-amylase family glycosyl hydrolase [Aquimarina agarilytica]
MKSFTTYILCTLLCFSCAKNTKVATPKTETPFIWGAANLYFLLTDRFNNGDKTNDINFDRTKETAVLRGFKGGDLKGITQKINEGYFTKLGINAIWMTPIVEQIHGGVDEGTGLTYGFHGYWTKDWTALDPNFGTKEDLKILVETAHKNGIRIVLDAVINHTGPVTKKDAVWPTEWVRETPTCQFKDYDTNVNCALVTNLPDIKTEINHNVEIPLFLAQKWKKEGRFEQETAELDTFFKKTGYPRAPRFYIMKWLSDYITDFGIDGYRCDTVKHTEPYVWKEFKAVCQTAFDTWKTNHPDKVLDNTPFYLVGEVYHYNASKEVSYNYGDKKVNYYNYGFNSLINFDVKNSRTSTYENLFFKYANLLNNEYKGVGLLNYMTSHDDAHPFDKSRKKPFETANRLLLCPGTAQVYYGDESARNLDISGTVGDATLRSFMNWEQIETDSKTQEILNHWQKLGQFRKNHPAIGAGMHQMIAERPYVFQRTFSITNFKDRVIVALDVPKGEKNIPLGALFPKGTKLIDTYSGVETTVLNKMISITTPFDILLLEEKK